MIVSEFIRLKGLHLHIKVFIRQWLYAYINDLKELQYDAVEAHCCIKIWTEVNYMSKICNRKVKNLGRFDLEGLRQPRRLKMRVICFCYVFIGPPSLSSSVSLTDEDLWGRNVSFFTLPVVYFACIIDFRSNYSKLSECNHENVLYFPAVAEATSQPSQAVPKCRFSEHVKAMHKERDSGFEREYQVCLCIYELCSV